MSWRYIFLPEARDEFLSLDKAVRIEIAKGLDKVAQNPEYPGGYGKPLGNIGGLNLAGLYKVKFKKSGMRVVYALRRTETEMVIIVIAARADDYVYKEAKRRRKLHGY